PYVLAANRITPSALHDPPRGLASASVCATPPSMAIRFSLLPATNATDRLSGDQKGEAAPSVARSGCHDDDSIERSHNCRWPSADAAATRRFPSGDNANAPTSLAIGIAMSSRISRGGAVVRRYKTAARPVAMAMAVTTQGSASRSFDRDRADVITGI